MKDEKNDYDLYFTWSNKVQIMNLNEKMKFNRNREGKGNTFSSIIEKLNDYKDHLVIDTDGEV